MQKLDFGFSVCTGFRHPSVRQRTEAAFYCAISTGSGLLRNAAGGSGAPRFEHHGDEESSENLRHSVRYKLLFVIGHRLRIAFAGSRFEAITIHDIDLATSIVDQLSFT